MATKKRGASPNAPKAKGGTKRATTSRSARKGGGGPGADTEVSARGTVKKEVVARRGKAATPSGKNNDERNESPGGLVRDRKPKTGGTKKSATTRTGSRKKT